MRAILSHKGQFGSPICDNKTPLIRGLIIWVIWGDRKLVVNYYVDSSTVGAFNNPRTI